MGHIRATGGPTLPSGPKTLQSSVSPPALEDLLQLNSSQLTPDPPERWVGVSHHSRGHVEFHQAPTRSPGQGAGTGTAVPRQPSPASDNCPQAGFPRGKPRTKFSLRFCCLSLENRAGPCHGLARRGLRLVFAAVLCPRPLHGTGSRQEMLHHRWTRAKCDGYRGRSQQNKTSSPSPTPSQSPR